MGRLNVKLCGIELDNPIIPASGTFGYGYEFAEYYDINCLGSFSFKGTTAEPRFGNPTPRIAETPSGMLNAVGLQNPGVERVISEELPRLARCFHKPVMANVSGFSIDEYRHVCELLGREEQVGWLEVNISCPNVHGGGMSFGTDPHAAEAVTRAVREVTDKPIIMKLSPNVTDITEIARACESGGADGISLINTVLGMRIDLARRRPLLANVTGGLSGSALLPIAIRMVYQVSRAVSVPGRRTRRCVKRGGRYRDDARRCDRSRGRRRESYRPLCLQKYYRGSACDHGQIQNRKPCRYYRRMPQ